MRVAVLPVRVVVGVAALMMVALLRFNRSRSAQASEMPVRLNMRMSVDEAPVSMDDACRRIAHSGHTVERFGTVTQFRRMGAGEF
jgi:hypothetical protein